MDTHLQRDDVERYFGASFERIEKFATNLAHEGEKRGLIGPRELDRLWDRHILNSAAVVPFIPEGSSVADLGSGAGLPGLVIACMRPEAHVRLVEPMERRCVWLEEMVETLDLDNVEVLRGRAEEFHGAFTVDVVTARAVAALDKLSRWALPLLEPQGMLVLLKGRNVAAEVDPARKVFRKYSMGEPVISAAPTLEQVEPTTVVTVARQGV